MIITPKVRGHVCVTAHPEGCAARVRSELDHVRGRQPTRRGPRNVLVIGSSTGYGLSSRIVAAAGYGASTLGVFFEREGTADRPGSAGWYNDLALRRELRHAGVYAESVNGDAFTVSVKDQVTKMVKRNLQPLDLVIYSLAAPRRIHPDTGKLHQSVIKPIGKPFCSKSVDTRSGIVSETTLTPATEDEVSDTVAVMGGDDWQRWISHLAMAEVLAEGVTTVAYSYIGPRLTWPIYHQGTIGRAKADLAAHGRSISEQLRPLAGQALVSVNQAVITQSSCAIPVVSLYLALLQKVMRERGLEEGCIEQMYRLFSDVLYSGRPITTDAEGFVRLDDLEQRADVQAEVAGLWQRVDTGNLAALSDIEGFRREFLRLFGFDCEGVNYRLPVDPAQVQAQPGAAW
ncbi:MAG: enoyl-ACP reductase FabV [Pseudomonadales bacterium]